MAITAKWYPNGFKGAMNKELDFESDPIKVMLLDDTYEIDLSNHAYVSDLEGEVEGDGYDEGGIELTGRLVSYNSPSQVLKLDADDAVWNMLRVTFRYAVIYNDEGETAEEKLLLGYIDFGDDVELHGDKFTMIWDSEGLLNIDLS